MTDAGTRTAPSPPQAPISWGELIDKITILEIKEVEIVNQAALANVRNELELLQKVAGTHVSRDDIARLKQDLKSVNLALWKIEDAIREKDRRHEFDHEFIALARSVYNRNDERARIKRKINETLNSYIVEEKSYKSYKT